jgi:hypothetical protein
LETYFAEIPAAAYKWVLSMCKCCSMSFLCAAPVSFLAIPVGFLGPTGISAWALILLHTTASSLWRTSCHGSL